METVYVLVQCDLGSEVDIIRQLMQVPEIKEDRYHNTYVHILALGHSILLSQGI